MRRAAWTALTAVLVVAGCEGGRPDGSGALVAGGDARRGLAHMEHHGCGLCHVVPGLRGGDGTVGPPLTDYALRSYIAGALPNTADNLTLWIMDPQAVEPGTAMPDLDVSRSAARDIAAYLYTLR